MNSEDVVREALAPFVTSLRRRAAAAEDVARLLEENGLLAQDFETVEVRGSKVGVETTTVGGLTVTFDAAGNAVRVTSPYGFEVIE